MRSFYEPSSQDTARYSLNPFQRVEIDIGGINRLAGEVLPQIEGTGFIVERADWPVIISLVAPANVIQQAYPAKNGLIVKAPFKSLCITHPLLTPQAGQTIRVSLIVFRGEHEMGNEFVDPCFNLPPSILQLVNTAVTQNYSILIPPGCKYLRKLGVNLVFTTITAAQWTVNNPLSAALGSVIVTDPVTNLTYGTTGNSLQGVFEAKPTGIATTAKLEARDILIPSQASSISIVVLGTGLVAPISFEAVFT